VKYNRDLHHRHSIRLRDYDYANDGAYKSLVFTRCLEISNENKCVLGKLWQRNYWEHIIRNETEYAKIAEYICDNPILWGKKRLGEILPHS